MSGGIREPVLRGESGRGLVRGASGERQHGSAASGAGGIGVFLNVDVAAGATAGRWCIQCLM